MYWTGLAAVYMEPFGTGPGVYTGPLWSRSGKLPNGSKTGLAKQQIQF